MVNTDESASSPRLHLRMVRKKRQLLDGLFPTTTGQDGNSSPASPGTTTTAANQPSTTTTTQAQQGGAGNAGSTTTTAAAVANTTTTTSNTPNTPTTTTAAAAAPTTTSTSSSTSSTTSTTASPTTTSSSSTTARTTSTTPLTTSAESSTLFVTTSVSRAASATKSVGSASASASATAEASGGISAGSVVGGVAGGILGLAVFCFAIIYAMKWYKKRKEDEEVFDAAQFRQSAMILPDDPQFDFRPRGGGAAPGGHGDYGQSHLYPGPTYNSVAPSLAPLPVAMSQMNGGPVSAGHQDFHYMTGYGSGAYQHEGSSEDHHYSDDSHNGLTASQYSYIKEDSEENSPGAAAPTTDQNGNNLLYPSYPNVAVLASPESPTNLVNPFAAAEYVPPSTPSSTAGSVLITTTTHVVSDPTPEPRSAVNKEPGYFDLAPQEFTRESVGTLDDTNMNGASFGQLGDLTVTNLSSPLPVATPEERGATAFPLTKERSISPLAGDDGSVELERSGSTKTSRSTRTTVYDAADAYGGF